MTLADVISRLAALEAENASLRGQVEAVVARVDFLEGQDESCTEHGADVITRIETLEEALGVDVAAAA